MQKESFVVIGAGPVGLCAALLMQKLGHDVTVYDQLGKFFGTFEDLNRLKRKPFDSFPVLLNSRSLHCLDVIDPVLRDSVVKSSIELDSWKFINSKITSSTIKAKMMLGICHDTFMLILSNYVREKKIPVNAGWKLVSINTSTKMAWFEDTSGSLNAVDCNLKRILACDGLCSSVKSVMEKESFGFQCETTPWSTEFRMLFSSPNASSGSGGLNTNTQYVINGHYIAAMKDFMDRTIWTVRLAIPCSNACHSDETVNALRSIECSYDNINTLRQFLKNNCPQVLSLFPTNDAFIEYFRHRPYCGHISSVNFLNHDEFMLLLGDAAHSIVPFVAESMNAGLEDCEVLFEVMRNSKDLNYFVEYNKTRISDTRGLISIAKFINDNNCGSNFAESSSRMSFRVVQHLMKELGITSNTLDVFIIGPKSEERVPYSQIAEIFQKQQDLILPLCRMICYPLSYVLRFLPYKKTTLGEVKS